MPFDNNVVGKLVCVALSGYKSLRTCVIPLDLLVTLAGSGGVRVGGRWSVGIRGVFGESRTVLPEERRKMGRRGKEEVPQEKQTTGHKEGREVLGGGQERLGNEYAAITKRPPCPYVWGEEGRRGRVA